MPVTVTAVLDAATLTQLLAEVTPLTLNLGEGEPASRWMRIDRPTQLEFIEGQGLRLRTSARLQWTIAGASIPITLQSIVLRLEPVLRSYPDAGRLNVRVTVEDADLKNVPKLIDQSLISLINAGLAARPDAIGWSFAETLALRLPLPASMAPLSGFELDAGRMSITTGPQDLRVTLELPMHFTRGDRAASPGVEARRSTRFEP